MEEPRKRFPRKFLIGCIGVPLLGILALCGGPRVYFYFYERSVINEFRSNRAYYEGLVRRIQADKIPVDRTVFYILPENRYAEGTMLNVESGDTGMNYYDSLFAGTTVKATNWNGVLRVNFGMRVNSVGSFPLGIPSQYGVMYCAGDTAEPGAEESLVKFEDRWWLFSWFLGH